MPLHSFHKTPGKAALRLLIALAAALLAGCAHHPSKHWVEVGGQRFQVEVADDHAERERGLMFRDRLEPDAGMLFVHAYEKPLAYWMKNTRIALDILYFDAQRGFVSMVAGASPCSAGAACPNHPSAGPAKYVLELNAGRGSALGLRPGERITLGPGIPSTGQP